MLATPRIFGRNFRESAESLLGQPALQTGGKLDYGECGAGNREKIEVKEDFMDDRIFEQMMEIRESGEVNMLDTNGVQRLAFEREFYELVNYIEENREKYWRFIMTGEREE